MCSKHAGVRQFILEMLQEDEVVTVVDMEAGLEHLSRGTERGVDVLLAVLEPYFKSLETGRRVWELGQELGIPRVIGVANKMRDEHDRAAVRAYAANHGLDIAVEVPYDDAVQRADAEGRAVFDTPDSVAVAAVQQLTTYLSL